MTDSVLRPAGAPTRERVDRLQALKAQLHQRLVNELDLTRLAAVPLDGLRQELGQLAERLCQASPDLLSRAEQDQLVQEVLDEALGLGPLEGLLDDPTITDILINGARTVYVERNGELELTDVTFTDEPHLLNVIRRVANQVGRRIDQSSPMVDARLADGSRFNAIIPPLALDGSLVSIRRFGKRPLLAQDLLRLEALSQTMHDFLAACVRGRLNVLVSGGTGSGKTTLLNVLSAFIPDNERIITIEDAAELRLQQRHVGRLETRPANIEGTGEVTTRELVRNSLRMRPDRILVGECRGAEVLDMLQAMNTGHEGSLTTVHANDPRDALGRLEMMVGLSGLELPIWWTRRQIASAIDLIVQVSRLVGGPRKVISISELTGLEGDEYGLHELFGFEQTGIDDRGRARGHFFATGAKPACLARLAARGIYLADEMFQKMGPEGAATADRTDGNGSPQSAAR